MLLVARDRRIAAAEKAIINPATINIGLLLLVWPIETPKMIGKIGKIHGDAIVSTPPRIAKNICNIFQLYHQRGRPDLNR